MNWFIIIIIVVVVIVGAASPITCSAARWGIIFAQLFLGWGNQPRPVQLFCSRACCCSPGTSWGFQTKACFFRNVPHFDPGPVASWHVWLPRSPPVTGRMLRSRYPQAEPGQASRLPLNPHYSPRITLTLSLRPSQAVADAIPATKTRRPEPSFRANGSPLLLGWTPP